MKTAPSILPLVRKAAIIYLNRVKPVTCGTFPLSLNCFCPIPRFRPLRNSRWRLCGKMASSSTIYYSLSPYSFTDRSVVEVQPSLAQVSARSQERLQCTIHQGPFDRWQKFLFVLLCFSAGSFLLFVLFVVVLFLHVCLVYLFREFICDWKATWWSCRF